MTSGLVIPVGDLIGAPGKERPLSGSMPVSLHLGEVTVEGPMEVEGRAVGLIDAVRTEFTVSAIAHFQCIRCLTEWDETVEVRSEQYFRTMPDEDGYGIVDDQLDVSGPAQDELALSLPSTPLCKEDCLGLCPTCGTDLNSEPCGGHGEEPDSPFAALRDLFDS
jgi:uncharacterized protein